ncbi:hypothetical protein CO051_02270 [Candidatus Roizmanbacteria bacterium CG_4_9_14_0_2_um_filter_39_13]|uniref:Mannosylglycerate hydrolase MGH1-like glycoside hydrolase domain-containing protein n=2 Tax=Candidatus Roizmaniibacteriota TaxID=1752723 RepID=A0A2M8F0Y1_9BACT|nr:MAG: hypothetical protein COY15_02535 [Candidatus Roizmanbacteria bacterium CG_4_10_14_0_2_um_filter_39_12]PJC32944.1 MAG: hypothetical protein CO051_02270 [Candidatus Roizmanbacteria bacterium CG_4_9_14_0_2_um_filter_39_13]PJE61921.1 MAG: hypothetical protein COU87_02055 [Candidatus Roizmanbacteria bacterium CG10_big_fil_rev_8_21_14_0_10_39_12]
MNQLQQEIKTKLAYTKGMIKRRAQGALKYDYLVPNGVYEEQWDWDAFFMGVALTSEIPSEAIYLKNWSLNYILNSHPDGKVGGCITKDGEDPRLNHMKPFLAQGAYIGGKNLNDFSWLKPHWSAFKKVVLYREKMYWDKETDLGMWFNSMESGADNDAGLYRCESLKNKESTLGRNYDQMRKDGGGHVFENVEDYPHASVVAVDVNTYIYREYTALSKIAYKLNNEKDAKDFADKAKNIKKNMRKYLWHEEDGMYYNLDTTTNKHIKKVSYSCFLSLFGGIPTDKQAKVMIETYLTNPKHMLSKFGARTLSKQDSHYNNVFMLKPHSNWQGPVWPIANNIYMFGLINYGYQKEALELAKRISKLVLSDLDISGGMHENYDAETGKPLAAPNFVSWNILVLTMIENAKEMKNPFDIK